MPVSELQRILAEAAEAERGKPARPQLVPAREDRSATQIVCG